MLKYTLKRLLYIVVVFVLVSFIVYAIYDAVPIDQAATYMEANKSNISPEMYKLQYDRIYAKLGLDKPMLVRYAIWLKNMVTGNFGYSTMQRKPVVDVIKQPLLDTVKINVLNLILAFAITIPLAIRSAVKRGSVFDNTVQVVTILGFSLPAFITALLAILAFSVTFKIFPTSGMATPGFEGTFWETTLDKLRYMALPLIVLTFTSIGGLTRYIRGAMLDALSMDCIRTARAKGLKEKVVIYSHAFRNAQIIVITVMASWFLSIFSGSVMIERMFAWNGMGNVLVKSIFEQDYAVVFTVLMFYNIVSLVGNLLIDLIYAAADPRIRLT